MKRSCVVAVVLIAWAAVAWAGPLVPQHLPTDAKWVCHLNVEAVKNCELVKAFHKECPKAEECLAKMKALSAVVGMNPAEDLLGVTLYDTGYGRRQGVMLVHLKHVDQKKLLGLLKKKQPDHKIAKHGDRKLYSWTARKGRDHEHPVTACFADGKTIVFSHDVDHVRAALDVIDGKKKSLAADSPLTKGLSRKAMLVSRAMDIDAKYKEVTRCPVLKNCTEATVQWAERKGRLVAKYQLETDSEEIAQNFKSVVDGLRGLATLRLGDDEATGKMLDGLKCKAKNTSFTLTWQASTDDVRAAARKCMQKHKMRWEEWKKRKQKCETHRKCDKGT